MEKIKTTYYCDLCGKEITDYFIDHLIHNCEPRKIIFSKDGVIEAANCAAIMYGRMFKEYHPVVSTMCPSQNKNLSKFLCDWVISGYMHGGDDGYGLQFSINTLNEEDRNKMFNGRSLSLKEIGELIEILPSPLMRKYTLNFAVTSKSDLNPELMNKYFNKERCIVKITPIHETIEATKNHYEIVKNFDVYEKFEKPLVEAGWDVIVFIPSEEEDSNRITCGNSLIARGDD